LLVLSPSLGFSSENSDFNPLYNPYPWILWWYPSKSWTQSYFCVIRCELRLV
jgi:hypothetical protein